METPQMHPAEFRRPDTVNDPLYVIAVVFNPQRYRSRWRLYKEFERYVLSSAGTMLYTVECSFGERGEVFKEVVSDRHTIIHVRTQHEIWLKENLINLAIQRLPSDCKYVAWIDADIAFARHDWAEETVQQLQHYEVVQMFSHAHDLDADHCPYRMSHSFMYNYSSEDDYKGEIGDAYYYDIRSESFIRKWHPGFAWAARRSAIDHLGGLIDFAIVGAADHHMAHALVGTAKRSIPTGISEEYAAMVLQWQDRSLRHVRCNVGYVKGLLLHYFHGSKKNRKYKDRWKVLTDNDYRPSTDLKRDWQGVYQLTDRSTGLRDGCRNYFRERNEDCIYTDDGDNIFQ